MDPDPFEESEDGLSPLQVRAGYNYSGAVASDGSVFSWGKGEFGRLGYVDVARQSIPRQIDSIKSNRIKKLALGYYHAAAINDVGTVFCWGRGHSGQLGCGSVMNEDSVR